MNFEGYIRTDLALECAGLGMGITGAETCEEESFGEGRILRVKIGNEEDAKRIGKPIGEYLTFLFGSISELDDDSAYGISRAIALKLVQMARRICKKPLGSDFSVLAAGLGNIKMTPDAIGPEAILRANATGHIKKLDPGLFSELGSCKFYSFAPGVLGDTGIEAQELILAALKCVSPDLVVVVDALAARSLLRLGATVQMADCGISPGSGVGNKRSEISKKTLGVPVIAIGVPTVVDSATLISDVLSRADADIGDNELERALSLARGCFVAPRNCDLICERAGDIISDALDMAFGIKREELQYN